MCERKRERERGGESGRGRAGGEYGRDMKGNDINKSITYFPLFDFQYRIAHSIGIGDDRGSAWAPFYLPVWSACRNNKSNLFALNLDFLLKIWKYNKLLYRTLNTRLRCKLWMENSESNNDKQTHTTITVGQFQWSARHERAPTVSRIFISVIISFSL